MKFLYAFASLCLCLVSVISCDEEKQYSHREEIISQKIWEEDSSRIGELFLTDSLSLPASSVLDTLATDSITPKTAISQ